MNRTYDKGGFAAITCYRNSKNFGQNWITAGYSIWFLREARFLNSARMTLGTNCHVSGTGFLISNVVEAAVDLGAGGLGCFGGAVGAVVGHHVDIQQLGGGVLLL